jgi:uncharacterized protein YbaP (TraB family)
MKFLGIFVLTFLIPTGSFASEFSCKNGKRPEGYVPIEERYTQGLLFKIGRCGKAPSFILGTVHSDHPKVHKTVAFAELIMQQSAAAGFEYIQPENAGEIVQKYLFATDETRESIRDALDTPTLQKTTRLLQRFTGMLPSTTRKMKPWAAAVMLQYPAPVAGGKVLDMQLQELAAEQHIPLFGVETMEEQFSIFDKIPLENQVKMLQQSLSEIDKIDVANEEMLNAYVKEDLRAISKISDRETARIKDPLLKKLFAEILVTERNKTIAKRLYPQLVKGQRFLAVGALHLLGKEGLLKRLEELGYLIQPLSARTGDAQKP